MTSADREPLPSFAAPPVQHVSFALLLDSLPLRSVHLGLLWTEYFRQKYPQAEDTPPMLNQLEQFGGDVDIGQFKFEITSGFVPPQVVFRTADTAVSLGVQGDRLTHSWERQAGLPYPRYPALRNSFEQDAASFAAFCEAHDLGNIGLRQIEVSYVNVLVSGDGWDRHGELHKVLQPWSPNVTSNLGEPEDVRIGQRYLAERDGHPFGRLHISVEPHRAPDGPSTMRMALTFRGTPPAYSLAGIMSFVDDAHDRIVRAFTEATTSEMHELWGRER